MQAAVSAKLHIFGFDAGSGMPQSLLVWFFEPGTISSLIPPLAINLSLEQKEEDTHETKKSIGIGMTVHVVMESARVEATTYRSMHSALHDDGDKADVVNDVDLKVQIKFFSLEKKTNNEKCGQKSKAQQKKLIVWHSIRHFLYI